MIESYFWTAARIELAILVLQTNPLPLWHVVKIIGAGDWIRTSDGFLRQFGKLMP